MNLGKSPELKNREALLRGRYGGFMTVQNLMTELGVSHPVARRIAEEFPSFNMTGKPRYDIRDVAAYIERSRTPAADGHA